MTTTLGRANNQISIAPPPHRRRHWLSGNLRPSRIITALLIFVLVAGAILPILLLVSDSLRSDSETANNPIGLPLHPNWSNYVGALRDMNYARTVANTVLITGASAIIVMLAGSLCAWAIARHTRRWTRVLYQSFVAGLAIPIFVLITPLYRLMQQLHLLDTFPAVILSYAGLGLPFAVFFFTSFLRASPVELEEAAAIDGCGLLRTYRYIVLPLLRPATATLAIFSSLAVWNDLVVPLVLLTSDDKRTVTLSVYSTIGTHSYSAAQLLPTVVLGTIPLFLVFLLLQPHIIAGITAGSTK